MSANITVGFVDKRNSSRVTRPPGGYSNIFGTEEPKKEVKKEIKNGTATTETEIKVHHEVTTKIQDQTNKSITTENGAEEKIEKEENAKEILVVKGDEETGNCSEEVQTEVVISEESKTETLPDVSKLVVTTQVVKTESTTVNKVIQKDSLGSIIDETEGPVVEKIARQPAKRVPPGGFSSGLW